MCPLGIPLAGWLLHGRVRYNTKDKSTQNPVFCQIGADWRTWFHLGFVSPMSDGTGVAFRWTDGIGFPQGSFLGLEDGLVNGFGFLEPFRAIGFGQRALEETEDRDAFAAA